MVPLIRSRQRVIVAPADPAKLEAGDIVLARVAGTVYLHLVSAVDQARKRVQISSNRGRVNGWTSHDRVFGICVSVEDVPRPGADGKTVAAGGHPSGLGDVGPAGDAAERSSQAWLLRQVTYRRIIGPHPVVPGRGKVRLVLQ
jgi:hypothetical protein